MLAEWNNPDPPQVGSLGGKFNFRWEVQVGSLGGTLDHITLNLEVQVGSLGGKWCQHQFIPVQAEISTLVRDFDEKQQIRSKKCWNGRLDPLRTLPDLMCFVFLQGRPHFQMQRSADLEAAQGERTMRLLQASQFWVGFRICLVIRNDLELSSVAARVIISK